MKLNNPVILDSIIESLEKGNGIKASCRAANLNYNTYLDWINPDSPRFNKDFSDRVKKALVSGVQTIEEICLSGILKAGTDPDKPTWTALAWILERKLPKKYGVKQEIDHTSGGEKISFTPISFISNDKDK